MGAAVGLATEARTSINCPLQCPPKPGTWRDECGRPLVCTRNPPSTVAGVCGYWAGPRPHGPCSGPNSVALGVLSGQAPAQPGLDRVLTPVGCGWGTLREGTRSLQQPFSHQDRLLASSWKFWGRCLWRSLKACLYPLFSGDPSAFIPPSSPRELSVGDVDRPLRKLGCPRSRNDPQTGGPRSTRLLSTCSHRCCPSHCQPVRTLRPS